MIRSWDKENHANNEEFIWLAKATGEVFVEAEVEEEHASNEKDEGLND